MALGDDTGYYPPEDIFAPDNSEHVIWGYPLDLADEYAAGGTREFGSGRMVPGKYASETLGQYIARVSPMFPNTTADHIGRWFDTAAICPE